MSDDYTAVWETHRQRVTQAMTELRWQLVEADGTEDTCDAVLALN